MDPNAISDSANAPGIPEVVEEVYEDRRCCCLASVHIPGSAKEPGLASLQAARFFNITFVLVPQPVLTTSTYVVAWPQGEKFLGGDL